MKNNELHRDVYIGIVHLFTYKYELFVAIFVKRIIILYVFIRSAIDIGGLRSVGPTHVQFWYVVFVIGVWHNMFHV